MIRFSLSTERIKSIMLILYLLLAWPLPFVISLLLLIWCNVMKWLEAALGACLAGATGVGATSSSSLKPIRLSELGERRRWGTGATRVSSHRQRGGGIGVRVEGGDHPLRWKHHPNLVPPSRLFFSFFKRMCNYTPNCPAPPSNERSRNTWYLQVGRHKGAFATIGLQGLGVRLKKLAFNSGHPHQTKTDHLLWRKGAVYSVKANCSTSPLFFIQDCTTKHKGCRIGVEIVHNIWTCLKYWMLGWHVKDRKSFLSYFCQPFGKHTDEIFGLTYTRMIWTSVKCTVSCAAHLPSKGNGSSMTSIQATPSSTTLFLSKTGATDTWCTPDCSVYERGHDATYGQRVKIHTVPAVAAKNVLWLSVHTGIK